MNTENKSTALKLKPIPDNLFPLVEKYGSLTFKFEKKFDHNYFTERGHLAGLSSNERHDIRIPELLRFCEEEIAATARTVIWNFDLDYHILGYLVLDCKYKTMDLHFFVAKKSIVFIT